MIISKFILEKKEKTLPLKTVICCEYHTKQLNEYSKKEAYYGQEECIVCEVNQ